MIRSNRFEVHPNNFNNKMLKFYLLVYHPASLFLQTPTTCYKRKMHDTQQRFMSKLAGRFIEAEVI